MFFNLSPWVIDRENPHIKTQVKSRKEVLKAVLTHKMYERLTLKDISLSYRQSRVFFYYHSPQYSALRSSYRSHIPSTLKDEQVLKSSAIQYNSNEQSSVAVFCLSGCCDIQIGVIITSRCDLRTVLLLRRITPLSRAWRSKGADKL